MERVTTIAEVDTSYTKTGLIVRDAKVSAKGVEAASHGGLTAKLSLDGFYSLDADLDFEGPYVVTFGVVGWGIYEAAHI
ncbi:hypothetical protein GF373_02185, partial [bacterium]|nr:hypothetical protein [bacterium]